MKKIFFALSMFTGIYCGGAWAAAPDGQEAICASPAVIACENFEDRAVGNGGMDRAKYKHKGWAISNYGATGPQVTSDPTGVFDGSRALQLTYTAGNNVGAGFLDFGWTPSSQTIYYRWYTKYSNNFQWSYIASKHIELVSSNGLPSYFQFWNGGGGGTGSKEAVFYNYFTEQGNAWIPSPNMNGPVTVIAGQWYCFEARYTINTTPTSMDGYLQGWVNGMQHWEYPNVNLNNQSGAQGPISGTMVSGYWNCYSGGTGSEACSSPEDVHPLMYRWHDNFVVSTQRIGCLTGGGDTTPPAAPTNLQVSSLGNN